MMGIIESILIADKLKKTNENFHALWKGERYEENAKPCRELISAEMGKSGDDILPCALRLAESFVKKDCEVNAAWIFSAAVDMIYEKGGSL